MDVQQGARGADAGDFGGERVLGGLVRVEQGDAFGAEAEGDLGTQGGAGHVGVGGLEEAGARGPDEMMGTEFPNAAGEDVGRAGEAGGGRGAGLGVEAGRRAGLKNLAFGEQNQVVGQKGHGRGACGQDDRTAGVGRLTEMGGEGGARGVVQRHAGFVDQQDITLGQQARGGEGELGLAVGEVGWRGFGQRGGECIEQVRGFPFGGAGGEAAKRGCGGAGRREHGAGRQQRNTAAAGR